MQHINQYIRQELNELYTPSEISILSRLILGEIESASIDHLPADKFSHLSGSQAGKLEEILSRLKMSEPYQYVFGKCEFYGLEFRVTPDVLIPRPETEELVEWVLSENSMVDRFLDIGTGSGCIAVTLGKKMPAAAIHAWDLSDGALAIAAENAAYNGVVVHFLKRDILESFSAETSFDVIVSNPPYVMESEKVTMEENVLHFEPHEALFVPDNEPLLFYKRIAEVALEMLHEGGRLYFEVNRTKGASICSMLQQRGYLEVVSRNDLSGNLRMIKAVKPRDHG